MTAQNLVAHAKGDEGIEAIVLNEEEIPSPGPGEALVRMKAATLNFRDLIVVRGAIPGLTGDAPVVPLSCGCGEVVAIGDGVTEVKVGQRVSPLFALGWLDGDIPTMDMLGARADGTARQYAAFPAHSLVPIPDMLSDMEAATLPCAGLTAWSALTQHRRIEPGEWVLCHGTGGVSIAALQFAKAMGGKVAITSSSDAKLARARSLGADVTVNYRTSADWQGEVREAIGGNDIAIVVDVVGKDQLESNRSLLRPGGLIAAIGMLGSDFSWGREADFADVGRVSVGNRRQHEAMLDFCVRHDIRPVVDTAYDLARLQDAYRHLESGAFFGKIGINLL